MSGDGARIDLTPIAGLERHLHHLQGDARLALRAVREAVLRRHGAGGTRMSGGGAPVGARRSPGPGRHGEGGPA